MFEIIVAHNSTGGIGLEGKIPWHCPEDRKLFRQITSNSVVIMGRKTVETLPVLPDRIIFCISRSKELNNKIEIFPTLEQALQTAKEIYPDKKIFVAGGADIYNLAFENAREQISSVHISVIDDDSPCDKFFQFKYECEFSITEVKNLHGLVYYHYKRGNDQEIQYLDLLKKILVFGNIRNGRNGETKSMFGKNMVFDLQKGFPLLTTKKMFFRGIVEELLFFIRGDTDSKLLEEKGVNIWKGNTDRAFLDKLGMQERNEGIMGPLYGYQWRFFNSKYDEKTGKPLEKGVDQLKLVIDTIMKDPCSRRIMMTDFNPSQAMDGVLYPCHSILLQFYVTDSYLDMYCYNRSQDVFLGTPFNIASSALFLTLIASVTNLKPRYLHMGLGDVHIYQSHYEHVQEQIKRVPYRFPQLILKKIPKNLAELETLNTDDISILNYHSRPAIKGDMVA